MELKPFWIVYRRRGAIGAFSEKIVLAESRNDVFERYGEEYEINLVATPKRIVDTLFGKETACQ